MYLPENSLPPRRTGDNASKNPLFELRRAQSLTDSSASIESPNTPADAPANNQSLLVARNGDVQIATTSLPAFLKSSDTIFPTDCASTANGRASVDAAERIAMSGSRIFLVL